MDEAVAEKVPERLLGAAESHLDQNDADRHTTEHDDAAQSTPATPAEEMEQTVSQDTNQDTGESPSAETPTESATPEIAEPVTAEAVDTSDTAEPVTAEAVDTSDTAEPVTAEAVDTSDTTDTAEPVTAEATDTGDTTDTAEPVTAEATDTGDTTDTAEPVTAEATDTGDTTDTAEPTGASFTPVPESGEETTDDEDSERPRRLQDLDVGMELEGRVTSIALYGVFVDIGVGRDGLVHISEMSDTRINSPSDLVQIGDPVKVRVKSINLDSRRISLTMRQTRDGSNTEERRSRGRRHEADRDKLAELKVGEVVEGNITGLSSFGAFVDIGVGKDGLVHISELSEGRIEKPGDAVQVGETYSFKLLEVDPEGSRISLSLRRAQRLQKMRDLSPGQTLEGTVSGLSAFGAFVDIGVGRDGLVHISQLSTERIEKVEDVVTVGDNVSVRVLEVDPQSKRISLTMRPEVEEAEEEVGGSSEMESTRTSASLAAPGDRPEPQPRRDRERSDGREGRRGGKGRGSRNNTVQVQPSSEMYTSSDDSDEEEFSGNATLEDLVMKFGGSYRKDRRRHDEDEEDEDEDEGSARQRQRDAIRRTLKHDDEE
jgi:ribosomal protein S1